jgi:hypothetical protein
MSALYVGAQNKVLSFRGSDTGPMNDADSKIHGAVPRIHKVGAHFRAEPYSRRLFATEITQARSLPGKHGAA